jgi:hypothetical protein
MAFLTKSGLRRYKYKIDVGMRHLSLVEREIYLATYIKKWNNIVLFDKNRVIFKSTLHLEKG